MRGNCHFPPRERDTHTVRLVSDDVRDDPFFIFAAGSFKDRGLE
jgi:hypothetical protein